MEPKMTILFIGKKARTTRHDLLPIYLRVTINSKRFEVATNRHVRPEEWSAIGGKLRGRSESANDNNTALDLRPSWSMAWLFKGKKIIVQINEHGQRIIQVAHRSITN